MIKEKILKKDYILIILLCILYFLSVKNVMPTFGYLLVALAISFYFFPIRLFLERRLFNETNGKKIAKVLSYFIIGNIIAISALLPYVDGSGFFRYALFAYALLNMVLLFYFYFTESTGSNFILSLWTVILVSAATSL